MPCSGQTSWSAPAGHFRDAQSPGGQPLALQPSPRADGEQSSAQEENLERRAGVLLLLPRLALLYSAVLVGTGDNVTSRRTLFLSQSRRETPRLPCCAATLLVLDVVWHGDPSLSCCCCAGMPFHEALGWFIGDTEAGLVQSQFGCTLDAWADARYHESGSKDGIG